MTLSTFRRPRRRRGQRRRARAMLKGAAIGAVGTTLVLGTGALVYKHGKNFRSGFNVGRHVGRAEQTVRGVAAAYRDPIGTENAVKKVKGLRSIIDKAWERDRKARQAVANAVRGARRRAGFSASPRLIEFARRRHLSRSHKAKISRSLRNRNKGKKPVTMKERGLRVREAEARARGVRNVGYLTNAVTQGVREARMTARFLGIAPRVRSANTYRSVMKDVGIGVSTARGVTKLLRI